MLRAACTDDFEAHHFQLVRAAKCRFLYSRHRYSVAKLTDGSSTRQCTVVRAVHSEAHDNTANKSQRNEKIQRINNVSPTSSCWHCILFGMSQTPS